MSFKFVQNKECEYFPCHKNVKVKEFNCIFCYCPLYTKEYCCGEFDITNNMKDCSKCSIPHDKENYDLIVKNIFTRDCC